MDHATLPLILPSAPAIVRAANLDSIRPWREAIEENRRLPHWKARQSRFREYQDAMRLGFVPMVPSLLALKRAPLVMQYNSRAGTNSAATNYTWNSNALSAADDPLRWVCACMMGSFGGAADAVNIGGVASTPVFGANQGFWIRPYPAGATVNIFFDGSASNNWACVGVYTITGLLNATPAFTSGGNTATTTNNRTIGAVNGGAILYICRGNVTNNIAVGGDGMTENNEVTTVSPFRVLYASHAVTQDRAAHAVNTSQTSSTQLVVTMASWAP